jgi:hypothetical protein
MWINGAMRKTVRSMAFKTQWKMRRAYLDKSDISGLLTEALTADIETVFSNKTSLVCADSAGGMLAIAHNVSGLLLIDISRCMGMKDVPSASSLAVGAGT